MNTEPPEPRLPDPAPDQRPDGAPAEHSGEGSNTVLVQLRRRERSRAELSENRMREGPGG